MKTSSIYGIFALTLIGVTFTLHRDNGRALQPVLAGSNVMHSSSANDDGGRIVSLVRDDDSTAATLADSWRSDNSDQSSNSAQTAVPQPSAPTAQAIPFATPPSPMSQPEPLRHLVDAK